MPCDGRRRAGDDVDLLHHVIRRSEQCRVARSFVLEDFIDPGETSGRPSFQPRTTARSSLHRRPLVDPGPIVDRPPRQIDMRPARLRRQARSTSGPRKPAYGERLLERPPERRPRRRAWRPPSTSTSTSLVSPTLRLSDIPAATWGLLTVDKYTFNYGHKHGSSYGRKTTDEIASMRRTTGEFVRQCKLVVVRLMEAGRKASPGQSSAPRS